MALSKLSLSDKTPPGGAVTPDSLLILLNELSLSHCTVCQNTSPGFSLARHFSSERCSNCRTGAVFCAGRVGQRRAVEGTRGAKRKHGCCETRAGSVGMKVNKSGDSLICFNLLSLFEEFFPVFWSSFAQKRPMFTTLWANGRQLMLTYVNTIVKVTETIICAHGNSNPSVSS